MSKFGAERTALARVVCSIMDDLPQRPEYFLDNGTLLGIWRDNALIEVDDDFDLGVLVEHHEYGAPGYIRGLEPAWLERLCLALRERLSGTRYTARLVSTYAQKIEVYDPSSGSFPLQGDRYGGADFHHVTVDIQPHVRSSKGVTVTHSDFVSRGHMPVSP